MNSHILIETIAILSNLAIFSYLFSSNNNFLILLPRHDFPLHGSGCEATVGASKNLPPETSKVKPPTKHKKSMLWKENRNTARFETRLRLHSNRHKNFGEVVTGRFRCVCGGAFRVCLRWWYGDEFRRYSAHVGGFGGSGFPHPFKYGASFPLSLPFSFFSFHHPFCVILWTEILIIKTIHCEQSTFIGSEQKLWQRRTDRFSQSSGNAGRLQLRQLCSVWSKPHPVGNNLSSYQFADVRISYFRSYPTFVGKIRDRHVLWRCEPQVFRSVGNGCPAYQSEEEESGERTAEERTHRKIGAERLRLLIPSNAKAVILSVNYGWASVTAIRTTTTTV